MRAGGGFKHTRIIQHRTRCDHNFWSRRELSNRLFESAFRSCQYTFDALLATIVPISGLSFTMRAQVETKLKGIHIYYSNNMGELKSKVSYAIHRYINDELTEERFKAQIAEIIREFEKRLPKKLICQDVGLIVQEREQSILGKSDRFERLWALLDQVEPRIRENLNHCKEVMRKLTACE